MSFDFSGIAGVSVTFGSKISFGIAGRTCSETMLMKGREDPIGAVMRAVHVRLHPLAPASGVAR